MSNNSNAEQLSAAEVEDLKAVQSIPLDTDDGGTVVIEQQNMGGMQQVGGGEYKNSAGRSVEQAAEEQRQLQEESPVLDGRSSVEPPRSPDPDAPGLSVLGEQAGDPVEPNEPA
ncbi:MAG: hypothetical protein JWL72_2605 [Ilumatobacteraceae bacterium]|nr:hypothetical protein [Ilumatobacteraceae bacterium]